MEAMSTGMPPRGTHHKQEASGHLCDMGWCPSLLEAGTGDRQGRKDLMAVKQGVLCLSGQLVSLPLLPTTHVPHQRQTTFSCEAFKSRSMPGQAHMHMFTW